MQGTGLQSTSLFKYEFMCKEQELIDISFQLVDVMFEKYEYFKTITQEERMEWVARQLRNCGFDTKPMGMSWGVLRKN